MKIWMKILIILILIGGGILIYPSVAHYLDVEILRELIKPFGVFAPVIFALLYIVAGMIFLPLSVLSVAAGVLFGTFWGLITILLAATITAGLCFLVAKQFQSIIPEAHAGIIHKLKKTVEDQLEKSTFQTIFILRLLYVPYAALSYAAGLVKTCKFWPFVFATFCTNIVGSFVFVYLGAQLGKGWAALLIPAILIALSLLIPYGVKKLSKKVQKIKQ